MTTAQAEPRELEGKSAELLKIAELVVGSSDGRIRVAFNEEDESDVSNTEVARFLKVDGKRLGRDIESYGIMGDGSVGWEQTLPIFVEEVIFPLRKDFPESYAIAGEELRKLGESIYPVDLHADWGAIFLP